MTDPRYRPRDFCAEPDAFGKAEGVKWLPVTDERFAVLSRAARLQHLYAVRIRARAKSLVNPGAVAIEPTVATPWAARPGAQTEGPPLVLLAKKMGTSYPRLLRCLRGEIVMRLDDIAAADMVLGEISEVARAAAAARFTTLSTGQSGTAPGRPQTSRRYLQ